MIFIVGLAAVDAAEPKPSQKPYFSSGAFMRYVTKLACKASAGGGTNALRVRKVKYGMSERKQPLFAYVAHPEEDTGTEIENVYLIAGQHGDEQNSSRALDYFVRELKATRADYLESRRIIVVPKYNPDGFKKNHRLNAKKVDLNRDFPTTDGEDNPHAVETKAFLRLMKKYPASYIYNFHQPFRVVLYNPEDEEIAKPFALLADYPMGQDVGYPTPGSLGIYSREKKIPIITVELMRSMRPAMAPFIYEEIRLALFNAAFGCIPKSAQKSHLEKYLAE